MFLLNSLFFLSLSYSGFSQKILFKNNFFGVFLKKASIKFGFFLSKGTFSREGFTSSLFFFQHFLFEQQVCLYTAKASLEDFKIQKKMVLGCGVKLVKNKLINLLFLMRKTKKLASKNFDSLGNCSVGLSNLSLLKDNDFFSTEFLNDFQRFGCDVSFLSSFFSDALSCILLSSFFFVVK